MPARRLALAIVVSGVLAACGGGAEPGPAARPTTPTATTPSPSSTATPPCSPNGTKLHVEAKGVKFDKTCLAAQADTAFTIEFENDDGGVLHNIVIQNNEQFFDGEPFAGDARKTYQVDPIPAGIYTFYCKLHIAEMQGQFVVQ